MRPHVRLMGMKGRANENDFKVRLFIRHFGCHFRLVPRFVLLGGNFVSLAILLFVLVRGLRPNVANVLTLYALTFILVQIVAIILGGFSLIGDLLTCWRVKRKNELSWTTFLAMDSESQKELGYEQRVEFRREF